MFLHVITYNQGAIRLYSRAGFSCVGQLQNFYYINSGRQLDPSRQHYDAFIYLLFLESGKPLSSHQLGFGWPFQSCCGASHDNLQHQRLWSPTSYGMPSSFFALPFCFSNYCFKGRLTFSWPFSSWFFKHSRDTAISDSGSVACQPDVSILSYLFRTRS